MLKMKELSKIIPVNTNEVEQTSGEFVIDFQEECILKTGEHYGKISSYKEFSSKNGIKYGKFSIGTAKRYGEKTIVHELDRVFLADYRTGSELFKLFNLLGCVVGNKCYPERLLNKTIKFTLAENSDKNSPYKYIITEILPVDKIPEEYEFQYVKTCTCYGYEYTPVFLDAKPEKQSETSNGDSKGMNFKELLQSVSGEIEF